MPLPPAGVEQPADLPHADLAHADLAHAAPRPSAGAPVFAGVADAVAAVEAGLAFLAGAEVAGLPPGTLAGSLRGMGRAESVLAAARSRLLSAFSAAGGPDADGHPTVKSWLRWQTRSTGAAAGVQVWWMRRLAAHPRIAQALAAAAVSLSWARLLAEWSEKLPPDARDAADRILLEAAAGGADLPELSRIAEQLYAATVAPDPEPGAADAPGREDEAFAGRRVWLDLHWKGAGQLTGDLTPECAAALGAALESLGKKAGPEDDRTAGQRRHDALEELARLALGSGDLPDVAGQPAQVLLHVTLDQLAAMPGAAEAAAAWTASGAGSGWLRSAAAAQGYACDAKIMPVVTGHLDPAVLARLAAQVRDMTSAAARSGSRDTERDPGGDPAPPGGDSPGPGSADRPDTPARTAPGHAPGSSGPPPPGDRARPGQPRGRGRPPGSSQPPGRGQPPGPGQPPGRGHPSLPQGPGRPPGPGQPQEPGQPQRSGRPPGSGQPQASSQPQESGQAQGDALAAGSLLRWATDLLSGPAGLAAALRAGTTGPHAAGVSLPLDIGAATVTIPPHLRRAVAVRDRHCAWPGCHSHPSRCQVHHVIPRSRGGVTALHNLVLLCSYHHLVAIHRRGWTLTLHPDGTTTTVSPDRTRTYHSHSHSPSSGRAA